MSGALATAPRREAPGPLEYLRRWPIQAWLIAVVIFLYAPLVDADGVQLQRQRQAQHRLGAASLSNTTP